MTLGQYVFTQLCSFLPKIKFDWFVKKYEKFNYKIKCTQAKIQSFSFARVSL